MKLTLSVIKTDIGSIGGHVAPSKRLQETVQAVIRDRAAGLILDHYISHTRDDIAILMTHTRGEGDEQIHKLAWDAFRAGTDAARQEGLYGAGQHLLKDSISGNVRGMGPAVAEMEIEERPNEPFTEPQRDGLGVRCLCISHALSCAAQGDKTRSLESHP